MNATTAERVLARFSLPGNQVLLLVICQVSTVLGLITGRAFRTHLQLCPCDSFFFQEGQLLLNSLKIGLGGIIAFVFCLLGIHCTRMYLQSRLSGRSCTVTLVAHLLPQQQREEWLGDLLESRSDLIANGYRPWHVRLVVMGRIVLLLWAFARVKVSDLAPSQKPKQSE